MRSSTYHTHDSWVASFPALCTLVCGFALLTTTLMPAQSRIYYFRGVKVNERFRNAVGGGSDVNQDGYPDIVVGAYQWEMSSISKAHGRMYVITGRTGDRLYFS